MQDFQTVAVFYSDVDTRETGRLFFQITNNTAILRRADDIVNMAFPNEANFESSSVTVATWDRVGYFPARTDLVSV